MPRRGGDVQQQLRAGIRQVHGGIVRVTAILPEIFVVPNVFADGDANLLAVEGDGKILGRRLEVTVLVEHVVGRQQRLVARGEDAAVLQKRGGVRGFATGTLVVAARVANQQSDLSRRCGETLNRRPVSRDKTPLVQQIARRITADAELGTDDHFHPRVDAALIGGEDLRLVAREIADGGVELSQSDFHAGRFLACDGSRGKAN